MLAVINAIKLKDYVLLKSVLLLHALGSQN